MLSKTIQDTLNEQIKNEFYSAYLYLAMSAYFESLNMPGSAKWMRAQYDEERLHALKLYDYVNDRNGRVQLKTLDQPTFEWASPVAAWENVVEHERKVTSSIHNLYALAGKENDYATQSMLKWFIDEQVEEEKNAVLMLERFRMAGSQPGTLLLFDGHFTKRGE
ncbi:MAG: ferritin [Chloroflexi bacterium]|nr:ferritin [Chloroflexota bacterium]